MATNDDVGIIRGAVVVVVEVVVVVVIPGPSQISGRWAGGPRWNIDSASVPALPGRAMLARQRGRQAKV